MAIYHLPIIAHQLSHMKKEISTALSTNQITAKESFIASLIICMDDSIKSHE